MSRRKSTEELVEKERIRKIMAKPVSPEKTVLYWIAKGRFNREF